MPKETSEKSQNPEKRIKPRSKGLLNGLSSPMVEIKFPGVPLYQLKIHDTADEGVGIVLRPDSGLLELIDVGQKLEVGLIAPSKGYQKPSGQYLSRIEHVTKIKEGPFTGHILVGIAFLKEIKTDDP